ncbi:MAG: hypothetical protein WD156_09990 [Acidimicrobiia bacterium]
MTSIVRRRVAGATALMTLLYLLQLLLASPSQADTHSPNDVGYWMERYPDAISCYKYTGSSAHGTLVDDGKAVELAVHQDDWIGDHWEVLVVNGGADDGGDDGNGNAVEKHPDAGVAYYPPVNDGDQGPSVSHWIVCKGYDYDIDGTPVFDIAACDEQGLTSVRFTVAETTEVVIVGVTASDSDPAFQPGDHELDLAPGTYTWILFSPLDSGMERGKGTFTVDECDKTTTTTEGTTTTTEGTTTTTLNVAPTTIVTQTAPSTTTTLPFDSLPEQEDQSEVLGTTITTGAETAPEEVSADTLPFTGSESGDAVRLAVLALFAGGLLLAAVREPKNPRDASDLGEWSTY